MRRLAISMIGFAVTAAACAGAGGQTPATTGGPAVASTTGAGGSSGSSESSAVSTTTATSPATTTTAAAPVTATTATPATTMPPIDTGTRDHPLPAGVPVTIGNWQVTVLSSMPDATRVVLDENRYNEPPDSGDLYTMVRVAATYQGEQSESPFLGLDFGAVGGSGVAYGFGDECGVVPGTFPILRDVFPGGTVAGNLCWSIAEADAGTLTLIAEATFGPDDERFFLEIPVEGIVFEAPPPAGVVSAGGPAGSRGNPIPAGQGALVGSWEVAVLSATPDATGLVEAENSFNDPPEADHQFFIVEIRATNRGIGSETAFSVLTFSAVGPSSVGYSFEDHCGVVPDPFPDYDKVFAGGTVSGNLCWSVTAADAAALVLIADAAFSIENERVFFEIP